MEPLAPNSTNTTRSSVTSVSIHVPPVTSTQSQSNAMEIDDVDTNEGNLILTEIKYNNLIIFAKHCFFTGMVADDDNSEQEDIADRPADRGKHFLFLILDLA